MCTILKFYIFWSTMFVQQYNGYYYLTEKRCGQTAKLYLWILESFTPDEEKELYSNLIKKVINSLSFDMFVKYLPYKRKVIETIIFQHYFYLWAFTKKIFVDIDKFLYEFVYHSNKSEGSRITYDDFLKVIQNKKPNTKNRNEIQEVENSFLARDFLMDDFVRNEANIKKLHKILTAWLIGDDGNSYQTGYKKHNNLVGNASTSNHTQVADAMKSLLSRYQKNKKVLFPLHLAFEFHYRFERIHPFADGNGRIGRLLMNKILYDNKFIPLTIFSENRTAYFRAFEKSIEKWSHVLYEFLIDQYKKTLDI